MIYSLRKEELILPQHKGGTTAMWRYKELVFYHCEKTEKEKPNHRDIVVRPIVYIPCFHY